MSDDPEVTRFSVSSYIDNHAARLSLIDLHDYVKRHLLKELARRNTAPTGEPSWTEIHLWWVTTEDAHGSHQRLVGDARDFDPADYGIGDREPDVTRWIVTQEGLDLT